VAQLSSGLTLSQREQERLTTLHSEKKQREFLAIRHLLQQAQLPTTALSYTPEGKPLLEGQYISITHSYDFVMIALSPRPVGIDIERCTPRILCLAPRFTPWQAPLDMDEPTQIQAYTQLWTIKEALYKIADQPSVRFYEDLQVLHFEPLAPHQQALVTHPEGNKAYKVQSFFWEGYVWSMVSEE
jgi:4'-phosphopantetheinyl transferase family protein